MTNRSEDTSDSGRSSVDEADAAASDAVQGWERAVTANGIPYFVSHQAEKTTWDHPHMTKALNALEGLNVIKYSAYRMAMKLRLVQKTTGLDQVTLACVEEALHDRHIDYGSISWNSTLTVTESEELIRSMFQRTDSTSMQRSIDVAQCTDLALNWILNTYDSGRTGLLHTMSVVTGTVLLCQGKLVDKYQALIAHVIREGDRLSRSDCEKFLQDCLQIPRQFFESISFGGTNVNLAIISLADYINVDSGMEETDDDFQVARSDMLDWLLEEPQTIVWLPTMHRLAAAETVRHESKCGCCKAFPIIGMRYRCLKCINYDMCQTCFFAGKVSHKHKEKHPMKEYCMLTTSGEDVKDFMKSIRNKLSTKKGRQRIIARRKSSFMALPVGRDAERRPTKVSASDAVNIHEDIQRLRHRLVTLASAASHAMAENEEDDHLLTMRLLGHRQELDPGQIISTASVPPSPGRDTTMQDNLHAVVEQLNEEKRRIRLELEELRSSNDSQLGGADAELMQADRRRLLDHIARLEQHNQALEEQLRRLRELLQMQDAPTPAPRALASHVSAQPRAAARVRDVAQQSPTVFSTPTQPTSISRRPSAASVTPVMLAASHRKQSGLELIQELHQPPLSHGLEHSALPVAAGGGGGGGGDDLASMVATVLHDLMMTQRPAEAPTANHGRDLLRLGQQIGTAMESLSQATSTTYSAH